jgi:hypothetical protein
MVDPVTSPGGSGVGSSSAMDAPISSKFPLPSGEFTIETHFDVLRRFMSVSRNGVNPVDASAVEGNGVPLGSVRTNCAFLCAIGLLVEEKVGQFKPTAVAMQFINTQLGDDSRGRRLLRSLIERTWFGAAAKAYLRTPSHGSPKDGDLQSALAQAAYIPAGRGEKEIRVLFAYLAYTGIYIPTNMDSTGAGGRTAPAPASAQLQPMTTPSARPPEPIRRSALRPASGENENTGWEEVQTNEFYLRIEPKAAAIRRLRKQLDLLEQKLNEQDDLGPKQDLENRPGKPNRPTRWNVSSAMA